MKLACSICAVILLVGLPKFVKAEYVIGPGDQSVHALDGSFDIIAVDLNKPLLLAPGSYRAIRFNYEFTNTSNTWKYSGTIKPLLLTGDGSTNFKPIAIGNSFGNGSYSGGFISRGFAGTDSFTLSAPTTIYSGVYWETEDTSKDPNRLGIGYLGSGQSFVVYGDSSYVGAYAPQIDTQISGTQSGPSQGLTTLVSRLLVPTQRPFPNLLFICWDFSAG